MATPKRKPSAPRLETLDDVAAEIRKVYSSLGSARTHVAVKVAGERLKALRLLAVQLRETDYDSRTRNLEDQISAIATQLAGKKGHALRVHEGAPVPRMRRSEDN